MTRVVHQVLSGAGPHDAVTTQARVFRSLFRSWGWDGDIFAGHIDPRIASEVRPLRDLGTPAPDALLLVHYSAYAPRLRRVLDLPNRKLLLSHNVTPARWFWDYEPTVAIHCQLGRAQLPEYAARADVVAGVSTYNAAELGSDVVIPILFDPSTLGPAGPGGAGAGASAPELLFVGRLAPHKRQDELIRLIALLRRHRLPDARLRLVGEPLNPNYLAALTELGEQLAPGAVTIESSLSTQELAARYRSAAAFVCLSEHEGFCIPLLEAFHLGAPVVARPVGGIPEVVGDAGLLVEDRDLAVVAELVASVVEDAELREALRAQGAARVAAFDRDHTAAALRAAVERTAAAPR